MRLASMDALLLHEIKEIYGAEHQLVVAMPRLLDAVSTPHLRELIENHLHETRGQVTRLEQIFTALGQAPRASQCKAMDGLIGEAMELINEPGETAIKDAALIAATQRIEHYEMAAYGAARTFAELLGYAEIADTLDRSLDEEKRVDENLSDLAMLEVNPAATKC